MLHGPAFGTYLFKLLQTSIAGSCKAPGKEPSTRMADLVLAVQMCHSIHAHHLGSIPLELGGVVQGLHVGPSVCCYSSIRVL
jgi:hypothetical protein